MVAVVCFGAIGALAVLGGEDGGAQGRASGRNAQHGNAPAGASTTSPFGTPDSFDVFATRNPFEPVIQVTTSVPPGGTVPTTVPGTTAPGQTTVSTEEPTFDPGQGEPVALLSVTTGDGGLAEAQVQVGSTVYTVTEGQTFATSYQVVSLDVAEGCGEFLFGDAPFSLCVGEQVIK
jgi:hypothetical protein